MTSKLRGLDLCTGIAGNVNALENYIDPIGYSETDPFARRVIESLIKKGEIPNAKIYGDLREIDGKELFKKVDIITSGFPCQDLSVAGHGRGLEGNRSSLFFDILSLSEEVKPTFIFLENVIGIRTRGLERVVRELSIRGYDCRWCSVAAAETKAPHQRRRWFLLAHSNRDGFSKEAKATSQKEQKWWTETTSFERYRWSTEPRVDRVAYGLQDRMDRVKCLGNSVVPPQVKLAFELLMGIKYLELASA